MKYFRVVLAVATLGMTASCGPIVSGVQTINANIALSAAETAGAKRLAVYEYTASREYLQKAREEHSYSDFWASRIYADKAMELALRAKEMAEGTQGDAAPAPPVLEGTVESQLEPGSEQPVNPPVLTPTN